MDTERETGDARTGQDKSVCYRGQIVGAAQSKQLLPGVSSAESAACGKARSTGLTMVDLQIVPFDRGYDVHGTVKAYHWAILAANGYGGKGTVYQLRGMPGNFEYHGPEDEGVLEVLENRQQELEIGRIPGAELKKLEASLEGIPVSQVEYGYNCQTWTEDALEIMESHNWLDYSSRAIVQWLKQLESRSE